MKKKIDIPDIPAVSPIKKGFQPPEAPKIEAKAVQESTVPAKPESTYSTQLSQILGVAPDPEEEARKEQVLKRKAQIVNLTGALKSLASSVYSDKGYITPRPEPSYLLARTQAELQRQKNAYAADVAAYNARRLNMYNRGVTLQQRKEIADQALKQRSTAETNKQQLANNKLTSINSNKAADRTLEESKLKEQARHNKEIEKYTKWKASQTNTKGDFKFTSGGKEHTIPASDVSNVFSQVLTEYEKKGKPLPFYKIQYDSENEPHTVSVSPNLNQMKYFIMQNYNLIEPKWHAPEAAGAVNDGLPIIFK